MYPLIHDLWTMPSDLVKARQNCFYGLEDVGSECCKENTSMPNCPMIVDYDVSQLNFESIPIIDSEVVKDEAKVDIPWVESIPLLDSEVVRDEAKVNVLCFDKIVFLVANWVVMTRRSMSFALTTF